MGFLDKAKENLEKVVKQGQEKVEEVQSKKKADALLRDLGAWTYATHTGRDAGKGPAEVQRIMAQLNAHEAAHGQLGADHDDDDDGDDDDDKAESAAAEGGTAASDPGEAHAVPTGAPGAPAGIVPPPPPASAQGTPADPTSAPPPATTVTPPSAEPSAPDGGFTLDDL